MHYIIPVCSHSLPLFLSGLYLHLIREMSLSSLIVLLALDVALVHSSEKFPSVPPAHAQTAPVTDTSHTQHPPILCTNTQTQHTLAILTVLPVLLTSHFIILLPLLSYLLQTVITETLHKAHRPIQLIHPQMMETMSLLLHLQLNNRTQIAHLLRKHIFKTPPHLLHPQL